MIVGLIPARSGSTRVKDKNIRLLKGYPLMAWAIAASKMCDLETIVSTDSMEYAGIAAEYEASVLMRPLEISGEFATDLEYIEHFIENVECEYIALFRCTTPLRWMEFINKTIDLYRNWFPLWPENSTSVRTVSQTREPVEKYLHFGDDGYSLCGIGRTVDEANLPSQGFKSTWLPNGELDIIKAKTVRGGSLFGDRPSGLVCHYVPEIDTEEDFDYIEWRLEKYGSPVYDYLKQTRT